MSVINWLENNMLSCPYKQYLGVDCFGCGMQRSLIELLKGNFVTSFYLYPALLPMIILFLFLIAHLIFKFKNGGTWLKYQFIFVVSIVVINFIVKLSFIG
ncbi:MAG: hypothetical protein COX70_01380 [Flavobacteriales bacterium CG_4_10_14_0_2_um_filter_32_8]|nr:MAG: hypothetical protein COX70_01380 [Flavobacteriales bacterium CG_4_10_14_0_2_um_filter_32_8]PJB14911.1 MAG: hypothetical protein CO118_06120 [Flavobacteriales bacterium CG_4_9_14_3_um_filter_32_8]